MSTNDKDFKVKNGLVVEGNSATVNGNQVLTTASSIDSLQDVNLSGAQNTNVLSYVDGIWVPVSDIGLQGTDGLQGISGSQGIQGIQGVIGPIGLQGILGAQGIAGTDGLQGLQGQSGIQGITGSIGSVLTGTST